MPLLSIVDYYTGEVIPLSLFFNGEIGTSSSFKEDYTCIKCKASSFQLERLVDRDPHLVCKKCGYRYLVYRGLPEK